MAFSTIKGFSEISGLSQYFVRGLVAENKIPFIRSGVKVYIDTERALAVLRKEGMEQSKKNKTPSQARQRQREQTTGKIYESPIFPI